MIRFLFYLAIAIVLVWFATTVQLGKHTLVGHVRAIWHTEEVRDLKDGVKERVEHGIHSTTGSDHQAPVHGTTAEAPQSQ